MSSGTCALTPGAVYTIATGRLHCSMDDLSAASDHLLGYPVMRHEFADRSTWTDLREALEGVLLELADPPTEGAPA